jgi:hypothetical protein
MVRRPGKVPSRGRRTEEATQGPEMKNRAYLRGFWVGRV